MSKDKETDVVNVEVQPETEPPEVHKTVITNPSAIPDDVAFDNNNLPYRLSRSLKKKINYGKDFNAYLVKGGTIYHKKSCKKLKDRKLTTKHVYECIADKNKKACPYCKPRAEIHEWYVAKFPDSIYAQAAKSNNSTEEEYTQLNLFD